MNTTTLESSILVLVDALTGLLVAAGFITLDVKTTVMAQIPGIVNDIIILTPLAYGVWHGVKLIALSIKKQLDKPVTGAVVVSVPTGTIA